MKLYFLNREKNFVECSLVEESPYKRVIKLSEGEHKGKEISVHPTGVAWGKSYPRVFASPTRPTELFTYKGRSVVKTYHEDQGKLAIPKIKPHYRFQPFTADVIDCVNLAEPVLLTGGAGVGKTTHITELAGRIEQPVMRINFNGETRMSDLIGKIQVVNGETVWCDGVLPLAMRNGYWLLLDEIDSAEPAVLSLLHPVLEPNPCLVLKENSGEVVIPHSNFRIFATANSIGAMQDRAAAYTGTNQMNEAFLDRWQVLMVNNLPEKEELKVVKAEARGIKVRWAKKIVQFANKIRNQNPNEAMEFSGDSFSTRKVIAWAKKTALLRDPIKGAKLAWLDKLPLSEQDVVVRILETHFGKREKVKREPKLKVAKGKITTGKKRGRKPKTAATVVQEV